MSDSAFVEFEYNIIGNIDGKTICILAVHSDLVVIVHAGEGQDVYDGLVIIVCIHSRKDINGSAVMVIKATSIGVRSHTVVWIDVGEEEGRVKRVECGT